MITSMRFQTTDAQPFVVVPTTINGRGPFDFVLDTGAAMSLTTEEIAGLVGVEHAEPREALGAPGVKLPVLVGRVGSLSIGVAHFGGIHLGILKELPRCVGQGIIGYNLLKNYRLTIDYPSGVLTLASADEAGGGVRGERRGVMFRIARPDRPIILVNLRIDDERDGVFVPDTGASQTVVSPELARHSSLTPLQAESLIGAGGHVRSFAGMLRSLSIGEVRLVDVPVMVSDIFAALSQAAGTRVDGILGCPVLRKFTLEIDYPRQTLWLGTQATPERV